MLNFRKSTLNWTMWDRGIPTLWTNTGSVMSGCRTRVNIVIAIWMNQGIINPSISLWLVFILITNLQLKKHAVNVFSFTSHEKKYFIRETLRKYINNNNWLPCRTLLTNLLLIVILLIVYVNIKDGLTVKQSNCVLWISQWEQKQHFPKMRKSFRLFFD